MQLFSPLELFKDRSRGDPSVTVCLLDGPVDMGHPALSHASIRQLSLSSQSALEPSTHGTNVAGILFGDGADVSGIVPECRGLSIPIWPAPSAQPNGCTQEDLAKAINMARASGTDVINISGGELSLDGNGASSALVQAIHQCLEQHVLVVAAVGNEGCLCPHVPANLPGVLPVGAMDESGQALPFSNWSPSYQSSGLLAPGSSITTARSGGGSHSVTGTSYAAAVTSGVVAWLMSQQLKLGMKPDALAIRDLLLATADRCDPATETQCERVLAGRLDLAAAYRRLLMLSSAEEVSAAGGAVPACHTYLTGAVDARALESSAFTFSELDPELQGPDLLCTLNRMELTMTEWTPQENSTTPAPAPSAPAFEVGAASTLRQPGVAAAGVDPSGCGCGCDKDAALVYAVGTIGYDFGSRAKFDSFSAEMSAGGRSVNPYDHAAMVAYLAQNPFAAPDLIWTLNIEAVPVYALQPSGAYSARGYELLAKLMGEQALSGGAKMVSAPGSIRGTATLQSGQQIPIVMPALRGLFPWSVDTLLETAVKGLGEGESAARRAQYANFFQRFFYELRNLGRTSAERAINFGGTIVFSLGELFTGKIDGDLVLHRIEVSRSLIAPQGGDCWDVSLLFFHPRQMLERSREVLRFTVDVSQEIPVRVGAVNSWATYASIG